MMSSKFDEYMAKVGSGYGPEFEIDAADLMTIGPKHTSGVVVGSARDAYIHTGSTVSDDVRAVFAQMSRDDIPIQPYKTDEADLTIAKYIEGAYDHAHVQTSEPKYNIFSDDDDEGLNTTGGVSKKALAAAALATQLEPMEEIAAAAVVAATASATASTIQEDATETSALIIPEDSAPHAYDQPDNIVVDEDADADVVSNIAGAMSARNNDISDAFAQAFTPSNNIIDAFA
jgi:hypothetical protein